MFEYLPGKKDKINDKAISCVVESEQDHGYIVEFGIEGVTGFLLKKECDGRTVTVGQVLLSVVTKVDRDEDVERAVVSVSLGKDQWEKLQVCSSLSLWSNSLC